MPRATARFISPRPQITRSERSTSTSRSLRPSSRRIASVCSPRRGGIVGVATGPPVSRTGLPTRSTGLPDGIAHSELHSARRPSARGRRCQHSRGQPRAGRWLRRAARPTPRLTVSSSRPRPSARLRPADSTRWRLVANRGSAAEIGSTGRVAERLPLAVVADGQDEPAVGGGEQLVRHDLQMGVALPRRARRRW